MREDMGIMSRFANWRAGEKGPKAPTTQKGPESVQFGMDAMTAEDLLGKLQAFVREAPLEAQQGNLSKDQVRQQALQLEGNIIAALKGAISATTKTELRALLPRLIQIKETPTYVPGQADKTPSSESNVQDLAA